MFFLWLLAFVLVVFDFLLFLNYYKNKKAKRDMVRLGEEIDNLKHEIKSLKQSIFA